MNYRIDADPWSVSICIGISEYENYPKLFNSKNDVKFIKQILENKYGFTDTKCLIDSSKEQLEELFEDNFFNREKYGPEDRIIIFYSGHGTIRKAIGYGGVEIVEGFIVPKKAKAGKYSEMYSMNRLTHNIKNIASKHILLIFDCCYSGNIAKEVTVPSTQKIDEEYIKKIVSNKTIEVLAATQDNETANASGVREGFSAFTGALLEILESDTVPTNTGILTAMDLSSSIFHLVKKHTKQDNRIQIPVYSHIGGYSQGQFILKIYDNFKDRTVKTELNDVYSIPIYQNDYVFEDYHIFSGQNLIKGKSKARIAIVPVIPPQISHEVFKYLDYEIKKPLPKEFYGKKYQEEFSKLESYPFNYANSLCALLSCSRLPNNFIGVAPYSKLFIFDSGLDERKGYQSFLTTHWDSLIPILTALLPNNSFLPVSSYEFSILR